MENKAAVVTGSTAGFGLAIAKMLAIKRAKVVINGRQRPVKASMIRLPAGFWAHPRILV